MNKKEIYFIRHGEALHNRMYLYFGVEAYNKFIDTSLLSSGYNQAYKLRNNWKNINKIELVLVSPLLRTLQTCQTIFSNKIDNNKIELLDHIIEYPQGNHDKCNMRKNKDLLNILYPNYNIKNIKDELKWNNKTETLEELNKRIQKFINFIGNKKEKHIAVISHNSFISQIKDKFIREYNEELKHCFPYKMIFEYNKNNEFIKCYIDTNML